MRNDFLKMTEDRLKEEQKRNRIQTNNINRILCWTNGNAIFLLFHFLMRINNHNIQYRTRLKKVQYRTRLKNVNKWRWHLANNHFMNLIPNTQSIQIVIKLSDLKWWLHHFLFIKIHLFLSLILHKPSEKNPCLLIQSSISTERFQKVLLFSKIINTFFFMFEVFYHFGSVSIQMGIFLVCSWFYSHTRKR